MRQKNPEGRTSKILRQSKVNNTKIWLRSWFVRKDPANVLYYSVSASDGSLKCTTMRQHAEELFAQLVEFEKRQMAIAV